MIKRLTWFVGGAIAGIAGASVAKRKAKEVAAEYTPAQMARKAGDRVVFMSDGQIVESNTPDEFFTNPQTVRAQDFLSKILTH